MMHKRLFTTSLTMRPTKKSPLTFHIDLNKIPSNIGHSTSRGMRPYNEDRYTLGILNIHFTDTNKLIFDKKDTGLNDLNLCPPVDQTIFAFSIFDGHGGNECSQFLKDNLYNNIELTSFTPTTIQDLKNFWNLKIGGYWKRWCRKIDSTILDKCLDLRVTKANNDHLYDEVLNWCENNKLSHWELMKFKLWLAHLNTDKQFLLFETETNSRLKDKSKLIRSGSTSTSAFLYPLKWPAQCVNRFFFEDGVISRLLIAHIGDTHAIICDKDGVAHPLTKDHHPSNPTESNRLRKFSAGLIMTDSFGEERYLNFANTRSFGDLSGKDSGVSAEPEFSDYIVGSRDALSKFKKEHSHELAKHHITDFGGDESFIVLVSDGVTNYLSDQEIVDLVMTTHNNFGVSKGTPQRASKEIVEFVECINGDDNATCEVIRLNGWGKWPNVDRTGSLREDKMMMRNNSRY